MLQNRWKKWVLVFSMGWGRVPVNMSAKSLWLFCWGFTFVHEGAEFKLLQFGSCTSGSTIMELERLRCSSKPKKMDRRSYCIDCSLHGKNNPTLVQPCHFCYALTPEKVYGTAASERFQNLQLFTLIMLLEDIYALVTKHHPTYFAQM